VVRRKRSQVKWDESTNEYIDSGVKRGFPLGGMGSGGFSLGTDGRFVEFRTNNNWMNPVRGVRGAFFALFARPEGGLPVARILRKSAPGQEYQNIRRIAHTRFRGRLPGFELAFEDEDLPVEVVLRGFTPHVPHDVKDSTIPAAVFSMELKNPCGSPVYVSALLSWENILGCGGTGNTGLRKITRKIPISPSGRVTYRDNTGNYQESAQTGFGQAVFFKTRQSPDAASHRRSVVGEHMICAQPPEGFEVTVCDGWDASSSCPEMLSEFTSTGRLSSPATPVVGEGSRRPAGAIAVGGNLPAGESRQIVFVTAWWMPEHVTEKDVVRKAKKGRHDGVNVGHVYENHFDGLKDVAEYVLKERERLKEESFELSRLVEESSLPRWMVWAIQNSIDSTLCNTVIPRSGKMYTLEGMDWGWPYGGLTGTNDQRLSAHPYSSVFFTRLDMSELDEFRRLMDERGSVPHGNGNCDLALGDATVPYGWPDEIIFILPAKEWTDLAMSEIVQAGKLYRITGDREWLERFWPDMKRMAEYLRQISKNGVPEGGTTYDIWDFPGSFIYSATVYLAAMSTMIDLAGDIEEEAAACYRERYSACRERIDEALWMEDEGYFRSTPEKNTVFTAAMAGDWLARYAGLEPVVEPERARRHMELQYRVLIENARRIAAKKGRFPKPLAHATPEGKVVKKMNIVERLPDSIYIWQVISYQAFEHIYLGQVEKGMDVLRMIYERLFKKGYTWSAGLMGNPDSVYMTHPVIWAALNAFTGAALDVPGGVLQLSPKAPPGAREMKVPFCFPGFWAMMTYEPASGRTEVEIKKHFGDPVTINEIRHRKADGASGTHRLDSPLEMKTGAKWSGTLSE